MITKSQFGTIEGLFNYYNKELFSGQLNDCMLNLSRKNGSMGFFAPERWQHPNGKTKIHEISINPDTFNIDDEEFHRTLIHEMCHLWQFDFGKPSRRSYHNKEWANKMISVGLMPSDTGKEGGNIVGQHMNDYTIEGGIFKTKFDAIKKDGHNLRLPYYPVHYPNFKNARLTVAVREQTSTEQEEPEASASGVRIKYTCDCGINVWGKSGLKIQCLDCNSPFEANS